MPMYRNKLDTNDYTYVQAIQNGITSHPDEVARWVRDGKILYMKAWPHATKPNHATCVMVFHSVHGEDEVRRGEWVLCDVYRKFSVCDDTHFHATYEAVN